MNLRPENPSLLYRAGLLPVSFAVYFYLFFPQVLHFNSLLSSITGDSIKNYYTYIYHIRHDTDFLRFMGMNFPYGDHVIYADCQPLLTLVLRALPFTHGYAIGIMHWLIFLSYVVTPVIMYEIFRLRRMPHFASAASGLAVALLTPLFFKLHSGFYALMYNCFIPLAIYHLIRYFTQHGEQPRILTATALRLAAINTALFLIHPYTGFSVSLFCALVLLLHIIASFGNRRRLFIHALVTGMLPILLFRVFMMLTDRETGRTTGPAFHEGLLANPASLLVPIFGPFSVILSQVFRSQPAGQDGVSYIGLFMIVVTALTLLVAPFAVKPRRGSPDLALSLACLLLLMFAFGYVFRLMDALHIALPAIRQFRAAGRFDVFTYFTLPVIILPLALAALERFRPQKSLKAIGLMAILFLALNAFEAVYLYRSGQEAFWKFRNFFSEKYLEPGEKEILSRLASARPQAIITLPAYLTGSEVIDRGNSNEAMIPSMMYSGLTGIPIIGSNLSRTPVYQSGELVNVLNPYKKTRDAVNRLNDSPLLVLKTTDELLPYEKRFASALSYFSSNDSLQFGFCRKRDLYIESSLPFQRYYNDRIFLSEKRDFLFLPGEERKPFTRSLMSDYEVIHVLQPNELSSGSYIASFHFWFRNLTFNGFACNLIMTRGEGERYEWFSNREIRKISGMYRDFAIYECEIQIAPDTKYEFILKGTSADPYHIRNFMLRKSGSLWIAGSGKDSSANNFPVNLP
jgi:hypothetical protein